MHCPQHSPWNSQLVTKTQQQTRCSQAPVQVAEVHKAWVRKGSKGRKPPCHPNWAESVHHVSTRQYKHCHPCDVKCYKFSATSSVLEVQCSIVVFQLVVHCCKCVTTLVYTGIDCPHIVLYIAIHCYCTHFGTFLCN